MKEGTITISIIKDRDRVIVGLPDQLGMSNRLELKRTVAAEIERGELQFVLDFSKTGYIDSSGMRALVSVSKQIRQRGGELLLTGFNATLRTLLGFTEFDTLLRPDDQDDGLEGHPAGLSPKPPSPMEGTAAEPRRESPPLS